MSRMQSVIFLTLSSLGLLIIFIFIESRPALSMLWAIVSSLISLFYSLNVYIQFYKIKSIEKILSTIGIIWSSICIYYILTMPMKHSGSILWAIFSLIYAIPFATFLISRNKLNNDFNESINGNLELIRRVNGLYKVGAISETEFNQKKSDLL